MKEFLNILQRSALFSGIQQPEILEMLKCLDARTQTFDKKEFVLRSGDTISSLGLLLSGQAHVIQEDFWGNRHLLTCLSPGDLFGETFACSPEVPLNVGVLTDTPCQVLFLHIHRIVNTCPSACTFHSRMVQNLLFGLAAKNLHLNEKLSHMSKRTTREKLLSYLSAESIRQGKSAFDIPFNRQQLADYLCVDRSALSSELGKLRGEGLLSFDKNHFILLEPEDDKKLRTND